MAETSAHRSSPERTQQPTPAAAANSEAAADSEAAEMELTMTHPTGPAGPGPSGGAGTGPGRTAPLVVQVLAALAAVLVLAAVALTAHTSAARRGHDRGNGVTPDPQPAPSPKRGLVEMTNVPNTAEVAHQPMPPLPPVPPLPGPDTGPTAAPAEKVSAEAAGQPALIRIARTNMLRAISRMCFAVEQSALPAPETVAFFGDSQVVDLEFSTMAQAEAWAVKLGADRDAQISENRDRTGTLYRGYRAECTWRGFEVTLAAIERAEQPGPIVIDPSAAAEFAEVQTEVSEAGL